MKNIKKYFTLCKLYIENMPNIAFIYIRAQFFYVKYFTLLLYTTLHFLTPNP